MKITIATLLLLCCVRLLRGEDAASNKNVIVCDVKPQRAPEVLVMSWHKDYNTFEPTTVPDLSIEDCSLDTVSKACRALFTDVGHAVKLNQKFAYKMSMPLYSRRKKRYGTRTFPMQKFQCLNGAEESNAEIEKNLEKPKSILDEDPANSLHAADIPRMFWVGFGAGLGGAFAVSGTIAVVWIAVLRVRKIRRSGTDDEDQNALLKV